MVDVSLNRHFQRAGKRFEDAFYLVMLVLALSLDVEVHLSLHCPLNDDTYHFINAESLEKMKDTAILVNTGRGPLVDEEAVAAALHEGSLGAYCADVMAQAPPSKENPLFGEPNAYLTPHIAWATYEARERLNKQVAANVKAFLEGNPINVVNK